MKIQSIVCGEYFTPDDETIVLISGGYIERNTVNTFDDCFEIIRNPSFDESEMISDADPRL